MVGMDGGGEVRVNRNITVRKFHEYETHWPLKMSYSRDHEETNSPMRDCEDAFLFETFSTFTLCRRGK